MPPRRPSCVPVSPRVDGVALIDLSTQAATRETEVGDAVGATLYDAYGDIVDTPAEIDELRALSFAAWRALRPPRGVASANDVMWAFGTRSTESRLQRARELLLAQWEALEEEAAP